MGFKPSCCWALGFFSFIGVLFYLCNAVMVYNRNWVFLTHKAGMDQFTSTEEDFENKMMQMIIVAGIMAGSMMFCCLSSCCLQKSEDA